jgi:hypothetical protein
MIFRRILTQSASTTDKTLLTLSQASSDAQWIKAMTHRKQIYANQSFQVPFRAFKIAHPSMQPIFYSAIKEIVIQAGNVASWRCLAGWTLPRA